MPSEINLRYQLTEDELLSMNRMYVLRAWYLRLTFVLALVVFLGGGVLLLLGIRGIEPFILASGAILLYFSAIYYNPLTRWRVHREPRYFTEHVWRFDDDGVSSQTEFAESKKTWSAYPKVKENARFFMLYLDENRFTPIPKRAFADREQLGHFRELLKRKIARWE
ncbi:MAG: YcxB family protein [Chloroflexota bacterium]